MAKVTGVFDQVPTGQKFPYVTIGDATEVPDRVFGGQYMDDTITLHIWSQAAGFKEALGIFSELNRILDGRTLSISGFDHIYTNYEFSTTLRDPDGLTRHISVRYRVLVTELKEQNE
jgi:hypothetical protein